LVFGGTGLALGLVGMIILWATSTIPSNAYVVVLGTLLAGLLGTFVYRVVVSDTVLDPTAEQKKARLVGLGGAALGLLVGLFIFWGSDRAIWSIVLFTAIIGGFTGVVAYRMMIKNINRKPDEHQKQIRVVKQFVSDEEVDSLRHLLTFDPDQTFASEHVIRYVSGYHWIKLVVVTDFWVIMAAVFIWGSTDFIGIAAIKDALLHGTRIWWLVGALLAFVAYFIWKQDLKSLFQKSRLALAVTIVCVWGYYGFPGAAFLQDFLEPGRPVPWLLAALVMILVALIRSTNYTRGYGMVTDLYVYLVTIRPWLLPNRVSRIAVEDVLQCESSETIPGNALGYGFSEAETAAQRDWRFHHMGPFDEFEEMTKQINIARALRKQLLAQQSTQPMLSDGPARSTRKKR
jgi:hypothetical protein